MYVLTLLERAKSAGVSVKADGDRLVVRGPKRAAAVMQELGQHKAAVMAVVTAKTSLVVTEPEDNKADVIAAPESKDGEPVALRPKIICPTQPPAPSQTSPATVVYNGIAYELTRMSGIVFFRRSREAGWTACSKEFLAGIEERLNAENGERAGMEISSGGE